MAFINLDVSDVYRDLERQADGVILSRLARCHIGTLMAESFCERCFSAGGLVSTSTNVKLNNDTIEHKVLCRMNKELAFNNPV